MLDCASDTCEALATRFGQRKSRVREKLESMIRSSNAQKMLSDAIVTIRNDRFVIPVKQEYRGVYGGIIHDQSSSGQTLFIEPQAIVQLNKSTPGNPSERNTGNRTDIGRTVRKKLEMSATPELLHNVKVLAQLDLPCRQSKICKR